MIVVGLAAGRVNGVDFKGSHFEREIVLWGVHWYVAYPISYRQLEEMMEERGVEVDHSSLNRWVLKYTVDFLLTAKRDRKAAVRFPRKAIGQNGVPTKITIDKSGANTAAIASYNLEQERSTLTGGVRCSHRLRIFR
jgi:putative transposase